MLLHYKRTTLVSVFAWKYWISTLQHSEAHMKIKFSVLDSYYEVKKIYKFALIS